MNTNLTKEDQITMEKILAAGKDQCTEQDWSRMIRILDILAKGQEG